MVISVDFDGTCVTHEFPKTGKDIGAEIVLKAISNAGHDIICVSMRSEEQKDEYKCDTIQGIKDWFKAHNIPLYGINRNPQQENWSKSRKIYANIYIDDQFLGCPLKFNFNYSDRFFVDWCCAAQILERLGIIYKSDNVPNKLKAKYPDLYI